MGGFHMGVGEYGGGGAAALGDQLRFVEQLRTAAQQQVQLDQQQREQDFKNQLELAAKNAVPMAQPATGGTIAKGGLGKRTVDNPAAQGMTGSVVTDTHGNQYRIPTEEERGAAKLNPGNSFTLTDELAQESGSMGGALTVGQRYPISVLDHLNSAAERRRAAEEKTGEFQQRTQERSEAATEKKTEFSERDKDREAAATEKQREFDLRQKDLEIQRGRLNEDREQRLQAAKDKREQAEEDRRQRRRDSLQKQVEQYQTKEQKLHGQRSAYGAALSAQDGENVIDPETGKQVHMDVGAKTGGTLGIGGTPQKGARRIAYEQKYKSITDQIGAMQDAQKKLVAAAGGGGDRAQSKRQLTDSSKVSEYLQKAGGDKEKARALARADGWEF